MSLRATIESFFPGKIGLTGKNERALPPTRAPFRRRVCCFPPIAPPCILPSERIRVKAEMNRGNSTGLLSPFLRSLRHRGKIVSHGVVPVCVNCRPGGEPFYICRFPFSTPRRVGNSCANFGRTLSVRKFTVRAAAVFGALSVYLTLELLGV